MLAQHGLACHPVTHVVAGCRPVMMPAGSARPLRSSWLPVPARLQHRHVRHATPSPSDGPGAPPPQTAPAVSSSGSAPAEHGTEATPAPAMHAAGSLGSAGTSSSATGQTKTATPSPAPRTPPQTDKPRPWLLGLLPSAAAGRLLATSVKLLKANLWALILLYVVKDCAAFVLHRISQRLTNLVSDSLLGTNVAATANPWWLFLDSGFLEANPGYQVCIVLLFLAALPLNILLSTSATIAAAQLCVPGSTRASLAQAGAQARAAASRPNTTGQSLSSVDAPKGGAGDLLTLAATRGSGDSSGPTASTTTDSGQGGVIPNTAASTNGVEGATTSSASSTAGGARNGTGSGAGRGATGGTSMGSGGSIDGSVGDDADAAAASTASTSGTAGASAAPSRRGIIQTVKGAFADVQATVPAIRESVKRVWWVDVLFNLQALPLQALSLLVLTVPWTVPRLLQVQLAVPAAVLEGLSGKDALDRSAKLMKSHATMMNAYGWPFVSLLIAVRVLDGIRNVALALIPVRWWQDVVEIPLLVTAGFAFAKMLVIRLQDMLPLAAYLVAQRKEAGHADDDTEGSISLPPTTPMSIPTM